jgi:hypothetical protein
MDGDDRHGVRFAACRDHVVTERPDHGGGESRCQRKDEEEGGREQQDTASKDLGGG